MEASRCRWCDVTVVPSRDERTPLIAEGFRVIDGDREQSGVGLWRCGGGTSKPLYSAQLYVRNLYQDAGIFIPGTTSSRYCCSRQAVATATASRGVCVLHTAVCKL